MVEEIENKNNDHLVGDVDSTLENHMQEEIQKVSDK